MPALLVVFFAVSGASSLILQVVWVRKLVGVFGSSSLAISTVLATFMAGLALGSWLGGRAADRLSSPTPHVPPLRDPLLYYGLCELAVAACAVAILPLIDHYRGANAWLWRGLGDAPMALAVARFALAAALLLVPTTAMGATLALLSRRITRSRDDLRALGSRLGVLYAANTSGAVAGAALAGFVLIPTLGVRGTNAVAALLASLVGFAVCTVVGWRAHRPRRLSLAEELDALAEVSGAEVAPPDPLPRSFAGRRLLLAVYALSGAIAMILEVLWSRALSVIIGSSTYSFTLILCTFLVGLSLGSALFARLASRTERPLVVLAWLFVAVSIAATATHQLMDDLPELFLALVEGTRMEVDTILGVHVLLTAAIALPAAIGLGAVMPIAIRAYATSLGAVGRHVGIAYAANTVGAIAGSVLGGFFVLPILGLEWGLRTTSLALAALALLCALSAPRRQRLALGLSSAAVAFIALFSPSWNLSDFTVGLFRSHLARAYIESGGLFQREIVYYEDGISTTVSVERYADGWVLRNNGKVEASNHADMPTQILVGLMPVLFHGGGSLDVYMIGYGSGVTVGAIATAPQVRSVDVVELEPKVYEAADRYFGNFNGRPEADPKVKRLLGDGRNVLLAGRRSYDVIVSEPSNPWIAGVASLFTREFYTLAKRHLRPGGVFCQWAQLYELGPENVKMIYRTFAGSFDYVYAFTPGDETTDTILLGSDRDLAVELGELEGRMAAGAALRAELSRAEIESAEDLVASVFLSPEEVAAFTAGAAENTDDNALLEFLAPRDLLASAEAHPFSRLARSGDWPYGHPDALLRVPPSPAERVDLARAFLGYGRIERAFRQLELAREGGAAAAAEEIETLAGLASPADFLDPELAITEAGEALPAPAAELFSPPSARGAADLGEAYRRMAAGRWTAAWERLRSLPRPSDSRGGRDVTLTMAYNAYKSLELEEARRLLESLRDGESDTARPALHYYLGRVHYGLGHFREGLAALETFRSTWPHLAERTVASRLGGGSSPPEE